MDQKKLSEIRQSAAEIVEQYQEDAASEAIEKLLATKGASITIRVSPVLKAQIVQMAGAKGMTMTEYIEHCIFNEELSNVALQKAQAEAKARGEAFEALYTELEKMVEAQAEAEKSANELRLKGEETALELQNKHSEAGELQKELEAIKTAFAGLLQEAQEKGLKVRGKTMKPSNLVELGNAYSLINSK